MVQRAVHHRSTWFFYVSGIDVNDRANGARGLVLGDAPGNVGAEALPSAVDDQRGFNPQIVRLVVRRAFFTHAELNKKGDDVGGMNVVELIDLKPLDHGQIQLLKSSNGEALHLDEFVLAGDLEDTNPFVRGRNII